MKKMLLLAIAAMALSFRAGVPDPLTEKERARLIQELQDTRTFFEQSVKGLSSEQLNFKAAPEKWSILQCMEHIAVSESGISGFIRQTLTSPADTSKKAEVKMTDDQVLTLTPDRSKKFNAPEFLQPTGKFATGDAANEAFQKARGENIQFIQSTQDDLRGHFIPHPAMGMLDTYQWFLLMAAHSRRHTLQIEEVKAAAGYPK